MENRLPVNEVWKLVKTGEATIVDVREPIEFACGHPQGALSLPYSQKGLEQRLAVILKAGSPIILFASDTTQGEAARLQIESGLFALLGVADGTIETWFKHSLPVQVLVEISIEELSLLRMRQQIIVLDVREPIEWELGYIPEAILISLGELRERISEVPREVSVAVICEAGIRSSSASSILQAAGFTQLLHVPEGTGGYRNAGLSLQFFVGDT